MAKTTTKKSIPENRNKTGQFKKGQSGNPGGRPKLDAEFKKAAQEHSTEALNLLVKTMNNEAEAMDMRIRAATTIIERAHGKPTQQQNIDMTVKNDIASFLATCGLRAVEADSDELGDEPSEVCH